jgi:hypothetical protein
MESRLVCGEEAVEDSRYRYEKVITYTNRYSRKG